MFMACTVPKSPVVLCAGSFVTAQAACRYSLIIRPGDNFRIGASSGMTRARSWSGGRCWRALVRPVLVVVAGVTSILSVHSDRRLRTNLSASQRAESARGIHLWPCFSRRWPPRHRS